jgi:hypothetical protein
MPTTRNAGGPIIWPLRAISGQSVQMLQSGAPVKRTTAFLQPVLMGQKPRRLGGLMAPDVPVNLPWNTIGASILVDVPVAFPHVVHQLLPPPPTYFRITGTTRDSTGAVLGNCTVDWFNTADDVKLDSATSDANGLFEFRTGGQPPNAYYLVAYKAGSPDVAGTTINTITGI